MSSLMIYPYTYQSREFIRFHDKLENYHLTAVVAPHLFGQELEQLRQSVPEILITNLFEEAASRCDAILFLDDIESAQLDSYAEKLNIALQSDKELLAVKGVESKLCKLLNSEQLKRIKIIGNGESCVDLRKSTRLKRINATVIAVLGLGEYCGKFTCELALRQYFLEQGYSVLQLGSKDYSSMFGFPSIPTDIFSRNGSTAEKILQFNQYLYDSYRKKKPDIIILGIPEGIMRVNNRIFNNFGEMAGVMGQAVQIDIGMLGVYYKHEINEVLAKYFINLREYCQHKINCPTDYIFISNTHCSVDENNNAALSYLHYDKVPPTAEIKLDDNHNIHLFHVNDQKTIMETVHKVHDELASNVAIV